MISARNKPAPLTFKLPPPQGYASCRSNPFKIHKSARRYNLRRPPQNDIQPRSITTLDDTASPPQGDDNVRSTLFIACAIAVLAFACTAAPSSPADREPNPQPGQSVATATKAPPAQSSATTQPEAFPPRSSINHPPPPTAESTLLPGSTVAPTAPFQVPTPTKDPIPGCPKPQYPSSSTSHLSHPHCRNTAAETGSIGPMLTETAKTLVTRC